VIFHSCVSLPEGKYGNLCQWRYQCLPHWTKMLREVMSRSCGVGVTCGNILKTKTFAWNHQNTHILYIYLHTSMTVYIQYPVFTSNEHVMKGLIKLCKEKPIWAMCLLLFTFFWSSLASNIWYRNLSIIALITLFSTRLFNHLAHLLGCLFFWHDGPVWYSYIIIYLLVGVHGGTPL
jgi:hypothetical protein